MQPLYRKQNAAFYQPDLSPADRMIFEWWAALLRDCRPRRVISHSPFPDKIIYTDAATETMILASLVFDKLDFDATGHISEAYHEVATDEWLALFSETNLIYGLELLAAVQTAADPRIDLDNMNVTFYIDNNNALIALIKADSKRRIIQILVRLFWAIMARRNITPWFERAPSDFNITDRPTRLVELPYPIRTARIFPFQTNLLRMVSDALLLHDRGFFDPDEIVGRYYPN